jgi:hypothetical protein
MIALRMLRIQKKVCMKKCKLCANLTIGIMRKFAISLAMRDDVCIMIHELKERRTYDLQFFNAS